MDAVEEKLDKIVKNIKPKYSFLLTLTGQGARIEKTFEPEISITPGCHYEIAFTSLESYYSIPNINESNNCLIDEVTNKKGAAPFLRGIARSWGAPNKQA